MPITSQKRPLRRTAALLCAVLAGLGLAAGRAAAQVTGPLGTPYTSPPQPTPYQWPTYHSGGGPVPAAQFPVAPSAAAATFLTPLIDPLQSQAQGTPTELYNGVLTQIPSFDLGAYDPTRPPQGLTAGVNTYYPDHLADGSIFSWAAPFSFIAQTAGAVAVDDTGPYATGSSFTSTGFTSITSAQTGPAYPAAGTATNGEYLRALSGSGASAVWVLSEPVAGSYSLYLHIPNDLPDSNGVPEPRSTQVVYSISVRDASGNVTSTSSASASQTEANDSQFLAGPFPLVAGGTVTVTLLTNTLVNNFPTAVPPDYVVADSMTLQQTTGDVQSAPTVITDALYPNDFQSITHPLQYWGIFVPPGSTGVAGVAQTVGTTVNFNANPDTTGGVIGGATINGGNILLKTGVPAQAVMNDGATADPQHLRLIRQLVYFGRSDPSASRSSSVDDSSTTAFAGQTTGYTAVTTATTPSASTASNAQYRAYGTAIQTLAVPVATWTVPIPTGGSAGSSYFVYAHIPATPVPTGAFPYTEIRLSQVTYTVSVNGAPAKTVAISQATQGTDALVALPTGPLSAAAGSIVVKLYNGNGSTTSSPPNTVVVADSVTVSTGSGQGAIYCVDGFTGGVVWRFETPGSANGSSSPVFSSPTVAKVNVLVTPAVGAVPAVYANRLVVFAGDNNGLVYCLDAIGNGDGTSNANVVDPTSGQPIVASQPAYGGVYGEVPNGAVGTALTAGTLATTAAATAHVGTTGVYWIYRPDARYPKFVTGAQIGAVKPIDPTADLPVPAAFNTASPMVFVDPTVSTTTPAASNSILYIGNSNGVLYALDGAGVSLDGTTAATFAASGDTFNVSQDLQGGFPDAAVIPTTQPLWWFSLRGPDPNSGNTASNADIESAPVLYVTTTGNGAATKYVPTVYIGSAHEQESTSNVGRLYALDGLYGPSGDNGRISPLTQPNPLAANYTGPGSFNYNVGQRPQTSKTDTTHWSFPDAVGTDNYSVGQSYNSTTAKAAGPRPALGNITGSPVVFTNIHETTATHQTRIYFAADSGFESTTATPTPAVRPDQTLTGRLWAVNMDGSVGTTTNTSAAEPAKNNVVWSYPLANDPNDAALDSTPEPYAPIGSFLRATPAIGFVQFPATILNGDSSVYAHPDVINATSVQGTSVPMLYVGTQGVNDTSLYAVDIDGAMTLPNTTATNDQRTIYRVISPDGSIFQASPALVTNATSTGGNGGAVYAVAGNTLYDYSATPISNPFAGQVYPLIRENRAYSGFGPISSPAIAGADTTDLSGTFLATGGVGTPNPSSFTRNTTDWIYVGDSTSGLCRGITPNDPSYGGIPVDLGVIIPPTPNPPAPILLNALIQTYLVKKTLAAPQASKNSSTDAAAFGVNAPLPVYEWGESAYARFTNVAPPNPLIAATGYPDPNLYVHDSITYTAADISAASATNPIPFYTSDGSQAQTVTFNLADTETGVKFVDSGSVQARIVNTPPDGFVADVAPATGTPASTFTTNLVANNGNYYLGTYTYTIADGTARNNTPGARRHFQNVRQTVTEWDYENLTGDGLLTTPQNYVQKGTAVIGGDATAGNVVSTYDSATNSYTFSKVAAVDQPTFGVLNPLAVRGGGVSLIAADGPNAIQIGDETGPFRGVLNALPTTTGGAGDALALQALTNGNAVLTYAPPSSSGVTGNPTQLATGTNDLTGVNTPTATAVIVTATGLIAHNTTGSNQEQTASVPSFGQYSSDGDDGFSKGSSTFGGYGLNVFDRGALYQLGQILRLKMTVPTSTLFAPPSGRDGLYWNSNSNSDLTLPAHHDAVVNFLPWETPPTPYIIGGNSSLDYPDIAPGSFHQDLIQETNLPGTTSNTGGDLTSNYVTLTPGYNTPNNPLPSRKVYGDPVNIQISIPHYQPPNQQLYQQNKLTSGQAYSVGGQIAPVTTDPMTGAITSANNVATTNVFPMGYVTSKRLFVPNASGFYSYQRPYRDVRIYTGVPIDMRTSIVNPTTDIGKVPAAFGVQTEDDPTANANLFSPYNLAFQAYFKPLEVHNDGNVNLLNVHFDQKISNNAPLTLRLISDVVDPLSSILGYDLASGTSTYGVTGPRDGLFGGTQVPEQRYLIRTSLDSDLVSTYDRNPTLPANYYPGATFHKPTAGGSQPSTLSIPDSPETFDPNYTVPPSPTGLPAANVSAPPFVSIAMPFGTPVGTYRTSEPQSNTSLRLFEGIDTVAANAYPAGTQILYPPQYGKAVGGIGVPAVDTSTAKTGQPVDSSGAVADVYNGAQPLSTTGTQLTGTVVEQRLTDGATYGAVPMIDAGPQGTAKTGTPDFAPAAFRDPATGNLGVYWTSGRGGNGYGIYGAALPFTADPTGASVSAGYFTPTNRAGQWWLPSTPALKAPGTNSGLSIVPAGANVYAFAVNVSGTTPYNNTLYSYDVNLTNNTTFGTITSGSAAITPPSGPNSDASQVKYGVKGLYTPGYTDKLWAFWTATTRGRTALYYNSQGQGGGWLETVNVLPVPAGLTSVADASPLLMPITVGPASSNQIEVTYSGTSPDGKTDLYVSRYQPDGTTAPASSKLDLVAFPATTENLAAAAGGWYQARDVAWSRTGALNLFVNGQALLYSAANAPLFTKAIYDKASGLLVLTGVQVPFVTTPASGPTFTTNTVYVDAATGRIRFSPALLLQGTTLNSSTQNFAQIRATFSPTAHRLTTGTDSRANTGPVTFLDAANKANDAPGGANVEADRRWTIWRKSSAANDTASSTLYYKTQRLTFFVPTAIDPTKTVTVKLNGTVTTNYDLDYERGRLYFPIATGAEGETVAVNYTDLTNTTHNIAADTTGQNTVQWQDEILANNNDVPILDSATGLSNVTAYAVPIDTAINENNVAAFLDPFAGPTSSHKVWLFWNSTRNGTADIYSETIDPRFAPGP